VFWVISIYFNIRNTLPKSGTFFLGHPVYICIQNTRGRNLTAFGAVHFLSVCHVLHIPFFFLSLSIDIQMLIGKLENSCPVLSRVDMSGLLDNVDVLRGRLVLCRLRDFRFPPRSTWMRYALFWDITQRIVVIICRRFGTS